MAESGGGELLPQEPDTTMATTQPASIATERGASLTQKTSELSITENITMQPSKTETAAAVEEDIMTSSIAPKEYSSASRGPREYLQKRNSKSKLSKQDEVEEEHAFAHHHHHQPGDTTQSLEQMPHFEARPAAHIEEEAAGGDDRSLIAAAEVETQSGAVGEEKSEETSPSSENSDATIVATVGEGSDSHRELVAQASTDSSKGKNRLKRSIAVSDDTPPPEDQRSGPYVELCPSDMATPQNTYPSLSNTLQVSPMPSRRKSGHLSKDNSQNSFTSENGSASGLSRDSSFETQTYTDTTGVNLEKFIETTLNKNLKDRSILLNLEQDFVVFIQNPKKQYLKFNQMTSYHRMLVHRIAAFFGLDHNVDQSGKAVIVNKTSNTRLPEYRFSEHLQEVAESGEQPKKILPRNRDSSSLDEPGRDSSDADRTRRSLEERTEDYNRAKKRIFGAKGQQGELVHDIQRPSLKKAEVNKWVQQTTRPWSSQESYSSGYSTDAGANRKIGNKANSFSSFSRGDSRASSGVPSTGSRFSDSISSGLGGGKAPLPPTPSSPPHSAEQHTSESESSVSLSSPHTEPVIPGLLDASGQLLPFWVCTSYDRIPEGSILINPATREPYPNRDGTPLRWHPSMMKSAPQATTQPQEAPASFSLPSAHQTQPVVATIAAEQEEVTETEVNAPHKSEPTETSGVDGPRDEGCGEELVSQSHVRTQPPLQPPQFPVYSVPPNVQPVRYVYPSPQQQQQHQPTQTSQISSASHEAHTATSQGQIGHHPPPAQDASAYQGQTYASFPVSQYTIQAVEAGAVSAQTYPTGSSGFLVTGPPQGYPGAAAQLQQPPAASMGAPDASQPYPTHASQAHPISAISNFSPYGQPMSGQFYTLPPHGSPQVMTINPSGGPPVQSHYRPVQSPPSQPMGGSLPVIGGGGHTVAAAHPPNIIPPAPPVHPAGVVPGATGATQQTVPPQQYATYPAAQNYPMAPHQQAMVQAMPRTVTPMLYHHHPPPPPPHPGSAAAGVMPSGGTNVHYRTTPATQQLYSHHPQQTPQPTLPPPAARSVTPPMHMTYSRLKEGGGGGGLDLAAGRDGGGAEGSGYMAAAPPPGMMLVGQVPRAVMTFRPTIPMGPGGDVRIASSFRQPQPVFVPQDMYRARMPTSAVPIKSNTPPSGSIVHTSHYPGNQGEHLGQAPPPPGSYGDPGPSNAGRQGGRHWVHKSNSRERSSGHTSTQSSTPDS